MNPLYRLVRRALLLRAPPSSVTKATKREPRLAGAPELKKAITTERIERALDRLAQIMDDLGSEGQKCLPIYRRLETELAALTSRSNEMDAVRERLKRSRDRTAARPAA